MDNQDNANDKIKITQNNVIEKYGINPTIANLILD